MALVEVNDTKSNYYIDSAQYFDEPGVLTVLAIPINQDECLFLPYPGPIGKMLEPEEEMKTDLGEEDNAPMVADDEFAFGDEDGKWQKNKGIKGWWQKKRSQRWDRESKTDKFLKRIPENVEHIRILYPTSLGEHAIQAQLTHQITKTQSRRSAKVLGLTAALPFALLLDLITFTFVFTIADVAMIVSSSRKLKRGKVVEDLMASNHISFAPHEALDEYYTKVMGTTYKMPDNFLIEDLCTKLRCEVLIKTIRKVRNSKAHRQRVAIKTFEYRDSFAHEQPKQSSSYATLADIPPEYDDY